MNKRKRGSVNNPFANRPYGRLDADGLGRVFAASGNSISDLVQLEVELTRRKTKKAKILLSGVRQKLNTLGVKTAKASSKAANRSNNKNSLRLAQVRKKSSNIAPKTGKPNKKSQSNVPEAKNKDGEKVTVSSERNTSSPRSVQEIRQSYGAILIHYSTGGTPGPSLSQMTPDPKDIADLHDLRGELQTIGTRSATSLLRDINQLIQRLNRRQASIVGRYEDLDRIDPNDDRVIEAESQLINLSKRLIEGSNSRNLLNFKHNPTHRTHLRIIDADFLRVFKLLADESRTLELIALPELRQSNDENFEEFEEELEAQKYTDDEYIDFIDYHETNDLEIPDEEAEIWDRKLRDKVREILGMPENQMVDTKNLAQVAHAQDINPSYELNFDASSEDGGGVDSTISISTLQTLQYPNRLSAKLNGIARSYRSSLEETGVNALHMCFGFLTWDDERANRKDNLSPLILIPIKIERRSVDNQWEFYISSVGDEPFINPVLRKRLQDFDIDLPIWDEETDITDLFEEIRDIISSQDGWQLNYFVTMGVFQSAGAIMAEDLDLANWPEEQQPSTHPSIASLLGGIVGQVPDAPEDYYIDDAPSDNSIPETPSTILSADVSQTSAIIDVLAGKNLVVSGPPGTGKSQTIANMIAALLEQKKTVLFISEKMAALEVVKKRLDDVGLGPFVLELHSQRSQRRHVLDSLRERFDVDHDPNAADQHQRVERTLEEEKNRLRSYSRLLKEKVGNTGLTLFEHIGAHIRASTNLQPERSDLNGLNWSLAESASINPEKQQQIKESLARFSRMHRKIRDEFGDLERHPWSWMSTAITPAELPSFMDTVNDLSRNLDAITQIKTELENLDLTTNPQYTMENFKEIISELEKILESIPSIWSHELLQLILSGTKTDDINELLEVETELPRVASSIASRIISDDLGQAATVLKDIETHMNTSMSDVEIAVFGGPTKTIQGILDQKSISDTFKRDFDKFNEVIRSVIDSEIDLNIEQSLGALEAVEIIQSFPEECVYYLDRVDGQPEAFEVISEAASLADEILELNDYLEGTVDLGSNLSVPVLMEASRNLSSAGIFGRLKPSVRSGEELWSTLSVRSNKPDRSVMAIDLKRLADHRVRTQQLDNMGQFKDIAGEHYQELNTDFKGFLNAASMDAKLRDLSRDPYFHQNVIKNLTRVSTEARNKIEAVDVRLMENVRLQSVSSSVHLPDAKSEIDSLNTKLTNLVTSLGGLALKNINSVTDVSQLKTEIDTYMHLKTVQAKHSRIGIDIKDLGLHMPDDNDQVHATISVYKILEDSLGKYEANKLYENLKENPEETVNNFESIVKRSTVLIQQATDISGRFTQMGIFSDSNFKIMGKRASISDALNQEAALDDWNLLLVSRNEAASPFTEQLITAYEENPDFDLRNKWSSLHHSKLAQMFLRERSDDPDLVDQWGSDLVRLWGNNLDEVRVKFANLDEQLQKLTASKISELVYKVHLPQGNGTGRRRDYTEMSLLNHQLGLRRPSRSIRHLMNQASQSLIKAKPCFMMSPASIAQFLTRGAYNFDVVIIDEASQMRVEEAMGGIARGKQFVVVGDKNQLPPTSFFQRNQDSSDDDIEEIEESILDNAEVRVRDHRQLKWHYRSKHEDLIRFSNERFYKGDLLTFPPSDKTDTDLGVHYHYVDEGVYSGGRNIGHSSINQIEADWVIEHALEAIETRPERSIGIVTMNVKQADFISDLWASTIRDNPAAREYEAKWADTISPFFVKNLENVQGDERDHIIISTVYGPQERGGPVAQRFGPIVQANGHRRLNVLFSRARERIDLFSSMTSSDIRTDERSSEGVKVLKAYLSYANTGILEASSQAEGEPDSDFEIAVAERLRQRGFTTTHQVGSSGFRIDIGVEHEKYPHGYVAGIECDGRAYHSSRSARDNDILRQELLENQGWTILRVWSTDWFANPDAETDKLVAKLSDLIKSANQRLASFRPSHTQFTEIKRPAAPDGIENMSHVDDRHNIDENIDKFEHYFDREHIEIWELLRQWINSTGSENLDPENVVTSVNRNLIDYGRVGPSLKRKAIRLLINCTSSGWEYSQP